MAFFVRQIMPSSSKWVKRPSAGACSLWLGELGGEPGVQLGQERCSACDVR